MKIKVDPNLKVPVYDFVVGDGILPQALSEAEKVYNKIVVVCDDVIDSLFVSEMQLNDKFKKVVVASGEESKSFKVLVDLINEFSKIDVKRNDLIVAIGGGVLGDLAGFAASIYMRGVDYWQVPTTLVAMVDSSIGGKTGINTEFGKNLVGAFYHPKKIVADLKFLEKLPESEVLNGLGEMYKHALIADFRLLEGLIENPKSERAVFESAKVKIEIVNRDPFEQDDRMFLNVGHTIAHAIEKESEFEIPHGMAVTMGIKMESIIGNKIGIISDDALKQILNGLEVLNLNLDYKIVDIEEFLEYMKIDKKNKSDKICFAFVTEPGKNIKIEHLEVDTLRDLLDNFKYE